MCCIFISYNIVTKFYSNSESVISIISHITVQVIHFLTVSDDTVPSPSYVNNVLMFHAYFQHSSMLIYCSSFGYSWIDSICYYLCRLIKPNFISSDFLGENINSKVSEAMQACSSCAWIQSAMEDWVVQAHLEAENKVFAVSPFRLWVHLSVLPLLVEKYSYKWDWYLHIGVQRKALLTCIWWLGTKRQKRTLKRR